MSKSLKYPKSQSELVVNTVERLKENDSKLDYILKNIDQFMSEPNYKTKTGSITNNKLFELKQKIFHDKMIADQKRPKTIKEDETFHDSNFSANKSSYEKRKDALDARSRVLAPKKVGSSMPKISNNQKTLNSLSDLSGNGLGFSQVFPKKDLNKHAFLSSTPKSSRPGSAMIFSPNATSRQSTIRKSVERLPVESIRISTLEFTGDELAHKRFNEPLKSSRKPARSAKTPSLNDIDLKKIKTHEALKSNRNSDVIKNTIKSPKPVSKAQEESLTPEASKSTFIEIVDSSKESFQEQKSHYVLYNGTEQPHEKVNTENTSSEQQTIVVYKDDDEDEGVGKELGVFLDESNDDFDESTLKIPEAIVQPKETATIVESILEKFFSKMSDTQTSPLIKPIDETKQRSSNILGALLAKARESPKQDLQSQLESKSDVKENISEANGNADVDEEDELENERGWRIDETKSDDEEDEVFTSKNQKDKSFKEKVECLKSDKPMDIFSKIFDSQNFLLPSKTVSQKVDEEKNVWKLRMDSSDDDEPKNNRLFKKQSDEKKTMSLNDIVEKSPISTYRSQTQIKPYVDSAPQTEEVKFDVVKIDEDTFKPNKYDPQPKKSILKPQCSAPTSLTPKVTPRKNVLFYEDPRYGFVKKEIPRESMDFRDDSNVDTPWIFEKIKNSYQNTYDKLNTYKIGDNLAKSQLFL